MSEENKLKIVRDYTGSIVDVNKIFKEIAKEKERKQVRSRPEVRKCSNCGHTMHRHTNIERYEALKGVSKKIDEPNSCSDCECREFIFIESAEKCKCGHLRKYHLKKQVYLNGIPQTVAKCKYDCCKDRCYTFRAAKGARELSREEYHAYVLKHAGYEGSLTGPKIIEQESKKLEEKPATDPELIRKLEESEAENKADGIDI